MGEKGNVTSDELSSLMEHGSAVSAVAGNAGDAVTTVVTGGGTTVVTAASIGEKLIDKTIGLGGDEIHERLKDDQGHRSTGREARPRPPRARILSSRCHAGRQVSRRPDLGCRGVILPS